PGLPGSRVLDLHSVSVGLWFHDGAVTARGAGLTGAVSQWGSYKRPQLVPRPHTQQRGEGAGGGLGQKRQYPGLPPSPGPRARRERLAEGAVLAGAAVQPCQLPGALSFLPHLCRACPSLSVSIPAPLNPFVLIQYPRPAGDGLDEAMHRRMQERQQLLEHEMAQLLQELEQGPLEQQDEGWGAVLFGALQQWPFWLLAGVLLFLGLCFGCRRRSCEASSSSKDQSSCKTLGDESVTEREEDTADPEEGGEDIDMTLEADNSSMENDREGSPVAADDRDKDDVIEGYYDVKAKEDGDVNMMVAGKKVTVLELKTEKTPKMLGLSRAFTGCSLTADLMQSFTRVFVDSVSNSFYPVPEEAIGVGSAFEGWSPPDWDGVYRVLVPLNPPSGHTFHLEPNSAGQMAARTFSVRVELVCTCEREQLGEKLLCFLHHSREELWRKQQRSLLETLCTGSYLDVEKTSRWFLQMVRCSWLHVPQSYSWHLVFQPCSRSCQFQLSRGKRSLTVEMLFGVRQGDSDIFVVSQPTEAQKGNSRNFANSQPSKTNIIASTAWPETFAVAEAKFFQHIAQQMPCKRLHLKCLQLFTCILRGTDFSTSTWKTLVMHVLNIVPRVHWHRREFARRLWDIMAFLHFSLQWKRLDHFVVGNEKLPAEISLPPAMRKVEPLNIQLPTERRWRLMRSCTFASGLCSPATERSSLHRAVLGWHHT
ncbi:hypothetical protein DV515_00019049, partial [Chloebia gouldiae]